MSESGYANEGYAAGGESGGGVESAGYNNNTKTKQGHNSIHL